MQHPVPSGAGKHELSKTRHQGVSGFSLDVVSQDEAPEYSTVVL